MITRLGLRLTLFLVLTSLVVTACGTDSLADTAQPVSITQQATHIDDDSEPTRASTEQEGTAPDQLSPEPGHVGPRWLGPSPLTADDFARFTGHRFRGPCLLRIEVSREGSARHVEWLQPQDCIDEVKSTLVTRLSLSRFEPAQREGRPVPGTTLLTIDHCPCFPATR